MQSGHHKKTDGRGMRQYNYGQHVCPKDGVNGVSRARREDSKAAIAEAIEELSPEDPIYHLINTNIEGKGSLLATGTLDELSERREFWQAHGVSSTIVVPPKDEDSPVPTDE